MVEEEENKEKKLEETYVKRLIITAMNEAGVFRTNFIEKINHGGYNELDHQRMTSLEAQFYTQVRTKLTAAEQKEFELLDDWIRDPVKFQVDGTQIGHGKPIPLPYLWDCHKKLQDKVESMGITG